MWSHYLNQCWNIVNWSLRNKLQWNFNWNSNIFIQENALENIVCEMASILSRPQCVKRIPQNSTHDESTLLWVTAWCCQAKSLYLSQCWPRSMSPYDIARPHWVIQTYNSGMEVLLKLPPFAVFNCHETLCTYPKFTSMHILKFHVWVTQVNLKLMVLEWRNTLARPWSVWYKTKVGSQNQLWWVFFNILGRMVSH